jgi:hypothetical protein
MKERPILFSDPMVRAILDGRKTQTRRVVKPQPNIPSRGKWCGTTHAGSSNCPYCPPNFDPLLTVCPYGQPGDRLWVRETWLPWDASGGVEKYLYRATEPGTACDGSWKPSIFMPRHVIRITLEIVSVRVERVQEISEADAKAEGIEDALAVSPPVTIGQDRIFSFKRLWDSINAKRPGCSWGDNPWVWCLSFKRL